MGKKGGSKIEVTQYYMSEHFGICAKADALLSITIKEKVAWSGNQAIEGAITIDQPELFGGLKKEGGVQGTAYYLPGGITQVLPDALAQKLGRANGADCPGYRGLASVFFYGSNPAGFYWSANTPYLPGVWCRVLRAPIGLDPDLALIPSGTPSIAFDDLWKYKVVSPAGGGAAGVPADYIDPAYDDSGWTEAIGAFGTNGVAAAAAGKTANTAVGTLAGRGIWVRRQFNFADPAAIGDIALELWHDDGVWAWWNGAAVALTNHTYFHDTATIAAGLVGYANTLVVQVLDTIPGGSATGIFLSVDVTVSGIVADDANPAHIIYECLTNTDWGMGSPPASIDYDIFNAVAQTLYDERFGLSMVWVKQSSVQDFIQEVLDHIQAVLYVDPSTGLITIALIRGDYDADSLDILTPDNADLTSFSRKLWGDIVNEIIVTWTNPDNEQEETITAQDDSSIAIQGGVVSDSRNYYGVRNAVLALNLAMRDLRSAGQPLATVEAEVDRSQWALRPASVIKVTWPEYGITELVMRVQSVDYGRPGDPAIKVSLIEDVYGLDIGSYDVPPSSEWVDPAADPAAIDDVTIFTLPLFFAMGTTIAAFVESPEYPEVVSGVLATAENDDTFAYELWDELTLPNGDLEWRSITTNNIIGKCLLTVDLDAEATTASVAFDNIEGKTFPIVGGFAIIGDEAEDGNEIAMINTTDYDLIRGVLDTIPRAWPIGTPVRFVDASTLIEDTIIRSAGELVDYKLLSRTSRGLLALADASLESYTLTDRPWLPNRPANVTAYGEGWSSLGDPVNAISRPDPWVTVTWAIRNRVEEDSQVLAWTDSTMTAEDGQTTSIEVLDLDGVQLAIHDGLAGTSFDVPDADFSGHIVEFRIRSKRSDADGDFVSLQYFSHWVQVSALTFDSDRETMDSTLFTMDET